MTRKEKDSLTIESSVEWYTANRYIYKQLAMKVNIILAELLEINAISIHAIFNRAKDIESFKEKIKDPKYSNPQEQITDLAGIRIICYVESDIQKICKVIEDNFEIDPENSGDKSKLLGTDKVGYKSVHYIAQLNESRTTLPEYKKYFGKKFEIQIRTILQHGWAEVEHDRNYKFSGELPEEIQRRFKLVAGSLELADKEFDRIASEIDRISQEVEIGTKEGKLDFELNTTTIKQFLTTKFEQFIPHRIQPNFPSPESEIQILRELQSYGLNSLNDLNEIIPSDLLSVLKKSSIIPGNFVGLLRIIMIVHDWKKYFEKSYNEKWHIPSLKRYEYFEHYKVPIDQIERLENSKRKK